MIRYMLLALALTGCGEKAVEHPAPVPKGPQLRADTQDSLTACVRVVTSQCKNEIHIATCTQAYETELLAKCLNESERRLKCLSEPAP